MPLITLTLSWHHFLLLAIGLLAVGLLIAVLLTRLADWKKQSQVYLERLNNPNTNRELQLEKTNDVLNRNHQALLGVKGNLEDVVNRIRTELDDQKAKNALLRRDLEEGKVAFHRLSDAEQKLRSKVQYGDALIEDYLNENTTLKNSVFEYQQSLAAVNQEKNQLTEGLDLATRMHRDADFKVQGLQDDLKSLHETHRRLQISFEELDRAYSSHKSSSEEVLVVLRDQLKHADSQVDEHRNRATELINQNDRLDSCLQTTQAENDQNLGLLVVIAQDLVAMQAELTYLYEQLGKVGQVLKEQWRENPDPDSLEQAAEKIYSDYAIRRDESGETKLSLHSAAVGSPVSGASVAEVLQGIDSHP